MLISPIKLPEAKLITVGAPSIESAGGIATTLTEKGFPPKGNEIKAKMGLSAMIGSSLLP